MANNPITIPPFSNVPAPGSPIRSDWAQQLTQYTVDRLKNHEALPVVASNFGAGVASSGKPGVGPITLAAAGVYLIAIGVDFVPAAGGWGFAWFYPSSPVDANPIGTTLVDGRAFESVSPTLRHQVNALWMYKAAVAGTFYVRASTFTGSGAYNSIGVNTVALFTGTSA